MLHDIDIGAERSMIALTPGHSLSLPAMATITNFLVDQILIIPARFIKELIIYRKVNPYNIIFLSQSKLENLHQL